MTSAKLPNLDRKILLVDDDETMSHLLAEQMDLHREFAVSLAKNGAEAIEMTRHSYFDVVILDVGLPDIDGRDICRIMRKHGVKSPIIMLTGADTDADTILGLDAGANDYVTKPFHLGVLLARIRAHIRQHEHSDEAVFNIGHYIFHPNARLLTDNSTGKKVRLTDKESAILKYLYRAGGHTVGRDTMLGDVWGYNAGITTHTIETHIYRLRQKIERDPSKAEILITEDRGYRLAI